MKKTNGWKKIAGVAVAIAALGAAGAVLQPFLYSVWAPAITYSMAASNAEDVLQIRIDLVQRQVWAQADRLEIKFTVDGKTRLRELRQQLRRLIDQMKSEKAQQ